MLDALIGGLLGGIGFNSLTICRPVYLPWKRRLVELYDRLITVNSVADANVLWEEIEKCREEFRSRA